ncbi:MAG: nuclear transport factor 2 family protein [Deltaproteobacteria bacterium]|nr:nuclear transport factor 2 family protein [Deltaproteobacteria bacterium]
MRRENWVAELFQSIDNQDTEAFLAFLTDNVLFRFGNADPVSGKAAVNEVVTGFFNSVKGMHHDLIQVWDEEGVVICHGAVTYTRHNTTILTVPFANILKLDADLIQEYLIYADVSELYKNT